MLRPRELSRGPASQGGLGFDISKDSGPGRAGQKSTLKHAQEQASREMS